MKIERFGLLVTVASVVAFLPRLVVYLLDGDGEALAEGPRAALIAMATAGTALALILAEVHLVIVGARSGRRELFALAAALLGVVAFIATPGSVAGLRGVPLREVLTSPALEWLWSAAVVLGHSLACAGVMYASANVRGSGSVRRQRTAKQTADAIVCEYCARVFANRRGLGQHRGKCPNRPHENAPEFAQLVFEEIP